MRQALNRASPGNQKLRQLSRKTGVAEHTILRLLPLLGEEDRIDYQHLDESGPVTRHPSHREKGQRPRSTHEQEVVRRAANADAPPPMQRQEALPETVPGSRTRDGDPDQVPAEAILTKFKEGVKGLVDDTDRTTHHDLGLAYKEMGLRRDAIQEFQLAANDPKRACVCHTIVGVIELERQNLEAATAAFVDALHAEECSAEQEVMLCYEIGAVAQLRGERDDALSYFRQVQRMDPAFRDVADRIEALDSTTRFARAVREKDFPQLRLLLEENPRHLRQLLGLADRLRKAGRHLPAIELYEQVAACFGREGRWLQAVAMDRQALALADEHLSGHTDVPERILPRLGIAYQQLGLVSDALAAYDRLGALLLELHREKEAVLRDPLA